MSTVCFMLTMAKERNIKVKRYTSILFDLDGTLTDPKEGICGSVQYALHAFGVEEPDLNKLTPFIGPPLMDSFMEFYHMTEEQAVLAVEKYRERFRVTGMYENEVYEGIPRMLAACKKKGLKLGIASSKPTVFVEKILEHFELHGYFDVIVGSELNGERSKKSEVIEEALKRLSGSGEIRTDQVLMVGDRKYDVEGAKAVGMDCIGVEYGYAKEGELAEAGAAYVVKTVAELETLLLQSVSPESGGKIEK